MVFNLVIPGGVGGDLIKASYLVRMRIRRTQAVASMVIDRILGLLALFILAAIAGAIRGEEPPRCANACGPRVARGAGGRTRAGGDLHGGVQPDVSRASSSGSKFGLIVSELREMSTTYRGRLNVVFGCLALSVCRPHTERRGVLPGRLHALP